MSKYTPLWEYVQKRGEPALQMTCAEIQSVAGVPLDHSFLNYKKELADYGYAVGKISLKEQTVAFHQMAK